MRCLGPLDVRPVLDADGSQMLALAEAAAGKTLVIQGPPGTGKSQTIANLIAEAVGRGRSVLFVAEKAAALEVVRRRLDAVGLGAACLELHSNRTRKREVLDELRRTLNLGRPRVGPAEADAAVLADLRGRLNAFAEAVNEPIGPSGVSPHEAAGVLLRSRDGAGRRRAAADRRAGHGRLVVGGIPDVANCSSSSYERRIDDLDMPADHPMRRSTRTLWTPGDRAELDRRAAAARSATEAVRAAAAALAEVLGVARPDRSRRRRGTGRGRPARSAAGRRPTWRSATRRGTSDRARDRRTCSTPARRSPPCIANTTRPCCPRRGSRDLVETREAINTVGRRTGGGWLSARHRRAVFRLATLCRVEPPRSTADRAGADRRGAGCPAARGPWSDATPARRRDLFGRRWERERSDFAELAEVARHVRRVRAEIDAGRLARRIASPRSTDQDSARAIGSAERRLTPARPGSARASLDSPDRRASHGTAPMSEPAAAEWIDLPFDDADRSDRRGERSGRGPARRRPGEPAGVGVPGGGARGGGGGGAGLAGGAEVADGRLPGTLGRGPARPGRAGAAGAGGVRRGRP